MTHLHRAVADPLSAPTPDSIPIQVGQAKSGFSLALLGSLLLLAFGRTGLLLDTVELFDHESTSDSKNCTCVSVWIVEEAEKRLTCL